MLTMSRSRCTSAAVLMVIVGAVPLSAQEPFQYREYSLESSIAAVVALDPVRVTAPRTLHERPATIQEVRWRAPYMALGGAPADPVSEILFTFYNDQLYQVVATYDRARMAGLTNADVVATLSATYGRPLLTDTRTSRTVPDADVTPDMEIVAQWEDGVGSVVTLVRSRFTYSLQYQLILTSGRLNSLARAAVVEARRLDVIDAPRRNIERLAQTEAAAAEAERQARDANKAAFRP